MEKARDYKSSTVKRLHTLSANQCAAPHCNNKLIARDSETVISKICHIEAASPAGPRFNKEMSDDDRRHFNNLILLCDECHCIIDNKDNESKYPVELLKEWKRNHENKQLYSRIDEKPSSIKIAINALADLDLDEQNNCNDGSYDAFRIDDKISYNAIKRNKILIDEYKVFFTKINALYNELESQGSIKKEKLLRNIKHLYLKIKGKYVGNAPNAIEIIQINADNIIEDMEDYLIELFDKDLEPNKDDISFAVSVVMVDGFMRCKILEEPPKK